MSDYINRELSWLEFNQRVLNQALRRDLPLLERVKFLGITASNLDEFFQVRVGGLQMLKRSGSRAKDVSGLTPARQLQLIRKRVGRMIDDQYNLFTKELLPAMQSEGISPIPVASLTETQLLALGALFHDQIFPLLTPLDMDRETPPVLPSLNLIMGVQLHDPDSGETRFCAVAIPDCLPRRVHFPDMGEEAFVLLEDLTGAFVDTLFPGEKVVCKVPFRVTRNGDIAVQEDDSLDFADEMEEVLVARKFSETVRLELPADVPVPLAKSIREAAGAGPSETYRLRGPLRLSDFTGMAFAPGSDHLKVAAWVSQPSPMVDPSLSMFENIAAGDILINNPFESFEPVVRFVEEAADDPDVIAIKQVLYRTASHSRFVAALIRAAESGKQVTVLVELKARFDEARNLEKAEELQRAGVQVVYGVKGLKTHAKVCLVIRRENGVLRRYCHFGTGNYNENTARIYTDISLLTCDEDLGADASQFFNSVTGRTRLMRFRKLSPSPAMMKARLIELIEGEAERARQGEPGHIMAKMNSLNDVQIMDALQSAAVAGVKIELNVRGICCFKPLSPKAAKNVRIVSIVDCYLEHARIFHFRHGGAPRVFIASADWMTRNLDKRVELMIPIDDPKLARRLKGILDACMADNTQACLILEDGSSKPLAPVGKAKPFRMQEALTKEARRLAKNKERQMIQMLEPHLPQE
ncbi:MAG: polyphosphate kinase 1 [Akkermansiaceae bacterium]|nr:polyphosphate kinase 1 [Akkermansiaceae bacterium]